MLVGSEDPWINSYPMHGKARSCPTIDHSHFSINLNGTGFYIPETVDWVTGGSVPVVNIEIRTPQQIVAECYGGCGGCAPSVDGNYAYGNAEEQTIDVEYEPELDITACIPEWAVVFAP